MRVTIDYPLYRFLQGLRLRVATARCVNPQSQCAITFLLILYKLVSSCCGELVISPSIEPFVLGHLFDYLVLGVIASILFAYLRI